MTEEELFKAGSAPTEAPAAPVDEKAPLIQPSADEKAMSEGIEALHKPAEPRTSVPPIKPPGVTGQPTPPEPEKHHVPLAELLDERDKRQRLERELQEMRAKTEPPKGYDPDNLFADPQGFVQHMQQQFEQRVALAELNADLRMTAIQHGDDWKEAWDTYIKHVGELDEQGRGRHPVDYYRVMNAPSPGSEIMAWYRERQWRDQVGNGPDDYQERLLNDPAFLSKVAARLGIEAPAPDEGARLETQPRAPNGQFTRSAPPSTRLPTSLSKAAGATGAHGDDASLDGSEAAIWKAGGSRKR